MQNSCKLSSLKDMVKKKLAMYRKVPAGDTNYDIRIVLTPPEDEVSDYEAEIDEPDSASHSPEEESKSNLRFDDPEFASRLLAAVENYVIFADKSLLGSV